MSNSNKVQILIVGGGPAGLSAAIRIKALRPGSDVCVIEKAAEPGNHNLSGALLEELALEQLLDDILPGWQNHQSAQTVLNNKVEKNNIMFLLGDKLSFNIFWALRIAKLFGLSAGQMAQTGDRSVSISRLTKWLGDIAKDFGAEVLTGFAAEDIILSQSHDKVEAVKLVDQGLDKEGNKQPNYLAGEIIEADFVILAEGCDGLLTEKLIEKANLNRQANQLYSVAVKELIKVRTGQYNKFTQGRVIHAMGYPLWTPVIGPGMFGGGIIYAGQQEHLSVGMIVGADWKYYDFNPQDALVRFKQHKFVRQFIEGGTVVEAGAKMIPEGGLYAIPRDPKSNSIGKGNCLILGDAAGFVNMLKIKGLHNAVISGIQSAQAIIETLDEPSKAATRYTELIEKSSVYSEMKKARNFRQTIAKFGPLFGMPLSVLGGLLPKFKIEKDYQAMTTAGYILKPKQKFDKDTFTALAATEHREDEPCHLTILDSSICQQKCEPGFKSPCITFCPAGVYETVKGQVKPANPSNCVHCKTCQRKCPFDNIRWTVPEGGGGPRYKRM